MSYADHKTPGRMLLDMLVETQTFRAMAADPFGTWAEIAAAMDGGTIAEGDAGDRVIFGKVNEDPNRGVVPEPPYGICRQLDEGTTGSRSSTVRNAISPSIRASGAPRQ